MVVRIKHTDSTHVYMLIVLFGLTVCENGGSERCCCTGCGDLEDQCRNRMSCRCLMEVVMHRPEVYGLLARVSAC